MTTPSREYPALAAELDRYMWWETTTTWPGRLVTIRGMAKPTDEDGQPAGSTMTEIIDNLWRSFCAVLDLAAQHGWRWAFHPEFDLSGETINTLDDGPQLSGRAVVRLTVWQDSLDESGLGALGISPAPPAGASRGQR